MKKSWFLFLSIVMLVSLGANAATGLINPEFIAQHLTKAAGYAGMHGAQGSDLGGAMLYYSLVYSMKAKTCVCLGSGDGFVPRVMRQAQRDLQLVDARTILIDGDVGRWGRPMWHGIRSVLKMEYPDIEIIVESTAQAARDYAPDWYIDYLHIDADRTALGALQDFLDYLPYMAPTGVITLHDVGYNLPCSKTVQWIKERGYAVIVFDTIGTGVAVITLQNGSQKVSFRH